MPPNWQNRTLFRGDNLTFLRAMNSETVDLIATDPPFNKGRDFHATPDSLAAGARFQDRWSWEDDVHDDWVDKITDDFPHVMNVIQGSRSSYGDDMGAFLCFMGVRLLEMRRVLKPTGSIYLHCDPTASHYLKELMDAVFGRENFRSEIVWRRYGSHNDVGQGSKHYGHVHDLILFYGRGASPTWNQVFVPLSEQYIAEAYRYVDPDGRRYMTTPLTGPGGADKGNPVYEWNGHTRAWRYSRETIEELDRKGELHYSRTGYARRKFYLDQSRGIPVQDVWDDIRALTGKNRERMGYPTQKPLPLYERIIRASSNPGDIVLDPFSGCATTCVAAERLGRQWIGMDIWDKAHETVIQRLQKEGQAADGDSAGMLSFGEIHYATEPPQRTDDGEEAAPFLRVKERIREPEGQKMSRGRCTTSC